MNTNHHFVFSGAATALITPFKDGAVDREVWQRLLQDQIAQGISALVVCGTTGEAPTLKEVERDLLLSEAVEAAEGRLPVIMGCGTNSTEHSLSLAKRAAALGADALLVVTPYYNKGTREGVRQHFLRIAEEGHLPVILYNVPGRTGVDLSLEDYAVLCEHPNIVGVKEASADCEKAGALCRMANGRFAVYSGNDTLLLPYLSLGGTGVISVVSNLYPAEIGEIIRLFENGKLNEARRLFFKLWPMMRLLFEETNPAPVKYAMSLLGYGNGELRLPLCTVGEGLRRRIFAELNGAK